MRHGRQSVGSCTCEWKLELGQRPIHNFVDIFEHGEYPSKELFKREHDDRTSILRVPYIFRQTCIIINHGVIPIKLVCLGQIHMATVLSWDPMDAPYVMNDHDLVLKAMVTWGSPILRNHQLNTQPPFRNNTRPAVIVPRVQSNNLQSSILVRRPVDVDHRPTTPIY